MNLAPGALSIRRIALLLILFTTATSGLAQGLGERWQEQGGGTLIYPGSEELTDPLNADFTPPMGQPPMTDEQLSGRIYDANQRIEALQNELISIKKLVDRLPEGNRQRGHLIARSRELQGALQWWQAERERLQWMWNSRY